MLFVSPVFLFIFFPIVFVGHFLLDKFVKKEIVKNAFLALASFVFYAWGGLSYALLILVSTVVNYLIGRFIGSDLDKKPKRRKLYLIIGLVYNIGILGVFKYFNFVVDNIEALIQISNPEFAFNAPLIPLPIGISFFTFQIMSYVIDVYRGNVKEQKSFINLALYIMLFPQLIAGPIVRYIDVEKQITKRSITLDKVSVGVERFIIGFAKKLIIANAGGLVADYFFNTPGNMSFVGAWIGIIGYAIQIYYDFSAYSDMAIGLGKMLGFDFLENFNYPYISKSIQEFWRRWHISLSSWFRDYLYIPLGGNRKGVGRTYVNLLIVFFVTGMWHGASWNFIVWGLFHGCFLVIERLGFKKVLDKIPNVFRRIYTLLVVLIGWVLFRAATLQDALIYIKRMFTFDMVNWQRILLVMDAEVIVYLIIGIIGSVPIFKWFEKKAETNKVLYVLKTVYLVLVFIIAATYMAGTNFNPFIYFIF